MIFCPATTIGGLTGLFAASCRGSNATTGWKTIFWVTIRCQNIDQRSVHAFRSMQEMSRTNYSELVTMAPVERMQIIGFRFGETDTADSEASRFWQANEMDGQSVLLHLLCSVFGDAYALVAPQDPVEDLGVPAITVEDPRYCAVEMDPSRPGRVMAALKIWEDQIIGKVLAVLYLPDRIVYYAGPDVADIVDLDVVTLTGRLLSNPHQLSGRRVGNQHHRCCAHGSIHVAPNIG